MAKINWANTFIPRGQSLLPLRERNLVGRKPKPAISFTFSMFENDVSALLGGAKPADGIVHADISSNVQN